MDPTHTPIFESPTLKVVHCHSSVHNRHSQSPIAASIDVLKQALFWSRPLKLWPQVWLIEQLHLVCAKRSHKDHPEWIVSVWQPVSSGVLHLWSERDLAQVRCAFLLLEWSGSPQTATQPRCIQKGLTFSTFCHSFIPKFYSRHPMKTTQ